MKSASFFLLLFTLVLLSCKKESSPAPTPLSDNLHIHTGYDPYYREINEYELIISENGKVLLDTVTSRQNKIVADLASSSAFVDVTVIHSDTSTGQYYINSFLHVDPSQWVTMLDRISYYSPIHFPGGSNATLHYINAPNDQPYFVNTPAPALNTVTPGNGSIDVSYNRFPGNYTYLLMPSTGLYRFYVPSGDHDTVDLSHPDTAAKFNFNLPAEVTYRLTFLHGFMDSTDLTNYLLLYSNLEVSPAPYDVEYPKTVVQKFELGGSFANQHSEYSSYYSFGDTVPTQVPFFDASSCHFSSTTNDDFAVQFNNLQPTYYETEWLAGKISLKIFSSPDSTVQHPLSFINGQKSKLLKNQDLSGLAIKNFFAEQVTGYDYEGYFNYVFNPETLKKKQVRLAVGFGKSF